MCCIAAARWYLPTPKLIASENTATLIGQLLDPPLRKRPPLTMGCGVQLEINDFLVEISCLSRYL
jgi:hypothetical protein